MNRRAGRAGAGREGGCRRGRFLLLLALLPALLLGPFGGAAVWIHSHGDAGGHVHLLPTDHDHEFAALEDWHAAQHRHGHGSDVPEDEESAPGGVLIELPELVPVARQDPSVAATACVPPPVPQPASRWLAPPREPPARPSRIRSGWPPERGSRSATATLLRSSHALLI